MSIARRAGAENQREGTSRCALLMVVLLTASLWTAPSWAQAGRQEPHIGYIYPAGGQQGSTFVVVVGGQNLRGVKEVLVTGDGVTASVIEYGRPLRNIKVEQRYEIARRMIETKDKRLAEMAEENPKLAGLWEKAIGRETYGVNLKKLDDENVERIGLPNHPLLYGLENMSLPELAHVRHELMNFRRGQQNAQIAESALIEVTIEPNTTPGDRELRLLTGAGLTNPMCFQVGTLSEVRELEPNDPGASKRLPQEPPFELPILLNGQVKPGDVDRFEVQANKGQRLVIAVQARSLVPYLADAVPGWFQATIALYDARGNELAYADDFRFDPDPVLYYQIPKDGAYTVEIRDSIYRGREDFVYRIAVGELPFVTSIFPMGGRAGRDAVAWASGWHFTEKKLALDTAKIGPAIREAVVHTGEGLANRVPYAVDTLPECKEKEPNDTVNQAQAVRLPHIVNGRIDQPGDADVFRIEGRAGDEVVAEVCARILHSPMDSLLRVTDESGQALEWNDDYMPKEGHLHTGPGLITHQADSYLRLKLPEDGVYFVEVADSQRQGGKAYGYRLRLSAPQPDFELRVTPSSINIPAGRSVEVCAHVLRKDGFDGDVELVLKDAPAGISLDGGWLPAGHDSIRMTISAGAKVRPGPFSLAFEGRIQVDGKTVSRPATPAEDMMQAFLWRHLVPSQTFMADVLRNKRGAGGLVRVAEDLPVRLPEGGSVQVRVQTPKHPILEEIELALSEPPEGIAIGEVTVVPDGLAFTLTAGEAMHQEGFVDNLIVEAFGQVEIPNRGGDSGATKRRVSLGILPAIPLEIVPQ